MTRGPRLPLRTAAHAAPPPRPSPFDPKAAHDSQPAGGIGWAASHGSCRAGKYLMVLHVQRFIYLIIYMFSSVWGSVLPTGFFCAV